MNRTLVLLASTTLATLLFVGLLAGCTPPSDPVGLGTLCVPATANCPQAVLLRRGAVGRNALDYELANRGKEVAVTVTASSVPDAADGPLASDDGALVPLYSAVFTLGPGERTVASLGPLELGTHSPLQLAIACGGAPCDVVLDYVFISQPLECIDDGECNRAWRCETTSGRCVECTAHSDCNANQSCDRASGRCTPPEASACATAGGGAGSDVGRIGAVFGPALVLAAALLATRRRRRLAALVAACAAAPLVFVAGDAQADPRAHFAVGGGARLITGELGAHVDPGYGFALTQELRGGWIGGAITLTTAGFTTTQSAPPYTSELRTYGVSLGPRLYVRSGRWEVFGGPDYMRFGVASNSLVRHTGLAISYHAAGATAGVRYLASGLEARLEASHHPVFGFPGSISSINLMVGLGGL